jgi:hypothetical protein
MTGGSDANLRIAAAVAGDTGNAILTGVGLYGTATRFLPQSGPYANIPDSSSVGTGKRFTQSQKGKFLDANEARNSGVLRSDKSGQQLVRPQKHTKGVTPPKNEAHVDHIKARSKGGSNSSKNAQVLSREENLKKGVN